MQCDPDVCYELTLHVRKTVSKNLSRAKKYIIAISQIVDHIATDTANCLLFVIFIKVIRLKKINYYFYVNF